jgi:hypothetical protein
MAEEAVRLFITAPKEHAKELLALMAELELRLSEERFTEQDARITARTDDSQQDPFSVPLGLAIYASGTASMLIYLTIKEFARRKGIELNVETEQARKVEAREG